MKFHFLRHTAGILFAGLLFLGSGCISEEDRLPQGGAPRQGEPIKIGVILPLTGFNAEYGSQLRDGITFAAEELNSGYGIGGRKVDLLFFDTHGDSAQAAAAVEKLAFDGAAGLIVGYSSGDVRATRPEIDRLRIPAVMPVATDETLQEGSPYLYPGCFTDKDEAKTLAAYTWYYRKLFRMGILLDNGDKSGFSHSIAQKTAQAFRDLGGTVSELAEFNFENKQLTEPIMSVLKTAPQAILISADAPKAGRMIRLLRQMGFSGLLLGPDSWDEKLLLKKCGPRPGDCAFIGFFSEESPQPETQRFTKEYFKRFHVPPGSCDAQGYDALKLLAAGLDRAVTIQDFQKNMRKIENFPGAAGVYSFAPDKTLDRTIYLKSIRPAWRPGKLPTSRLNRGFSPSKLENFQN